jgi:hypothetical protein
MNVTAKVILNDKGVANDGQVQLVFNADYADGRNKEWAKYTPALSLTMAVTESVAQQFDLGQGYTLTFAKE